MTGLPPLRVLAICISLASAIFNIVALYMLINRSERSISTLLWGGLLTFISLWCFAEIAIRSTDDFFFAISWFSMVLFAGGFVPPIVLHFALEFPRRHKIIKSAFNRWIVIGLLYGPNIILLIRALLRINIAEPFDPPSTIWGEMYTRDSLINAVAGDVFIQHYIFLAIMLLIAIYVIFVNMREAQNKMERKQLHMIFLALSIVFIPGMIFDMVLSMYIGLYTEIFSLLVTFLAIFTAYAIVRYKFLVVHPETEEITVDLGDSIRIEPGSAYVFPEGSKAKARSSLLRGLSEKREGIVITNRNPDEVRKDLNIEKTPVIYIGEETGYELIISPNNLDGLVSTMSMFLGATKSPIMVVDSDPQKIIKAMKDTHIDDMKGSGARKHFLEAWLGVQALMDLVEQSTRALSDGMSMVIFSYEEGEGCIRTKRPLHHMSMANFFLLKTLLQDILDIIVKQGGDPSHLLTELGEMDEFYVSCKRYNGDVIIEPECLLTLDRSTTVMKLRTLDLGLSRTSEKGASEALRRSSEILDKIGYTNEELTMPEGAVHLMATEDNSQAFDFCQELVDIGSHGLCISTRPPEKIKHMYGLKDIELKWLTTSKTSEKDSIPPSLEHIRRDIKDFIVQHKDSVIVLDGIELLVSRLGFEDVQRFLHVIKDEIATTRSRLLIPVHPKAIDEQRLALLKREIEI